MIDPMGKLLRILLNEKRYALTALTDAYLNLGGRGLASSILNREVAPEQSALGDANKIVIAPGILAGTTMPNSGCLSIGAKSPLTGTVKQANAGGSAAHKLARLGIQAVVLEGRADALTCIRIDHDGVSFLDAAQLAMQRNGDCIAACRRIHGDAIAVISIGPAGEMQLKAAGISVTSSDLKPLLASRGGLGAVMGSKNVKALVIDDSHGQALPIKDLALFKASAEAFTKGVTSHPLATGLNLFGTPVLVGMINEAGALVTKNFSKSCFESAEKIPGAHIADLMKKRTHACSSHRCMSGCIMNCSNVFLDENGKLIVSGLEYETIVLMGSKCRIDDINVIARINAACNDIGVDTIDVSAALAAAMEAGQLAWGDGLEALTLVEQIGKGTETGRILGNGCRFTRKILGAPQIPHPQGQALAGYEPRVLKGTGATYASCTMGADHTCGNTLPGLANPVYNPLTAEGQAPVSQFLQRYFAAIDTLGLCLFASLPVLDMPELQQHLIDCVSAVLDASLDENYLMRLGASVLNEERQFNLGAGLKRPNDRLPEFFKQEPIAPLCTTFDASDEELDSVHR
jgi:aldehyde:ferredoxin oxidoreductase